MAQRRPRDTHTSNPHGTAPHTRRAHQQSPWHSATHAVCNPHGTAPPTRHAHQQSPWHSATHPTRTPAIPMAQRHPHDTHASNPHGTAPPTRHAHQQSAWHSATHATRTPAIRMAQRHPAADETRTPSSQKQHTTGEQPAPARTTDPPYDRPPATKSNSAIRFFAPATLTVTQLLQFSNPCNTHPSNTHP